MKLATRRAPVRDGIGEAVLFRGRVFQGLVFVALAFLSEWLRRLVNLTPVRERMIGFAAAMHQRRLDRDAHGRRLSPRS